MEIIEGEIDEDIIDKCVKVLEKMSFDFNWNEYTETYTQEIQELIERKALGEEVEIPEFKPPEIKSLEAELEKMLVTVEEESK